MLRLSKLSRRSPRINRFAYSIQNNLPPPCDCNGVCKSKKFDEDMKIICSVGNTISRVTTSSMIISGIIAICPPTSLMGLCALSLIADIYLPVFCMYLPFLMYLDRKGKILINSCKQINNK